MKEMSFKESFKESVDHIFDEILSRFADLRQQVEDLKCCGNCVQIKYKSCPVRTACIPFEGNNYCPNYQPDNLTRKERE
jgi:hypothetical protein